MKEKSEELTDKIYTFFSMNCGVQLPKKRKGDLEYLINKYLSQTFEKN